jgi:hypothetical protein
LCAFAVDFVLREKVIAKAGAPATDAAESAFFVKGGQIEKARALIEDMRLGKGNLTLNEALHGIMSLLEKARQKKGIGEDEKAEIDGLKKEAVLAYGDAVIKYIHGFDETYDGGSLSFKSMDSYAGRMADSSPKEGEKPAAEVREKIAQIYYEWGNCLSEHRQLYKAYPEYRKALDYTSDPELRKKILDKLPYNEQF